LRPPQAAIEKGFISIDLTGAGAVDLEGVGEAFVNVRETAMMTKDSAGKAREIARRLRGSERGVTQGMEKTRNALAESIKNFEQYYNARNPSGQVKMIVLSSGDDFIIYAEDLMRPGQVVQLSLNERRAFQEYIHEGLKTKSSRFGIRVAYTSGGTAGTEFVSALEALEKDLSWRLNELIKRTEKQDIVIGVSVVAESGESARGATFQRKKLQLIISNSDSLPPAERDARAARIQQAFEDMLASDPKDLEFLKANRIRITKTPEKVSVSQLCFQQQILRVINGLKR
jgi:hypothetical protein